ncbi:MAG: hypothetical protein H7Z13_02355 [Ferruginibacter sp.]|nr:hypothetical protein [Ferruginibacter sp.]
MSYAVCTLFEGNYHYGVAALSNSLYKGGFRGSIYAGYRGKLPAWSDHAKETTLFQWQGAKTMKIGEGLQIHFLPLDTGDHFSNYKPVYMLRLFEGPAKDAEGLVYFDPDIVIKCSWDFFENWLGFGVAVVHEVISNDMPASHPIRRGWEELIKTSNRKVTSDIRSYLNGGFCGLTKSNTEFLKVWSEFIELAYSDHGHHRSQLKGHPRTTLFYCADQDAMNIAAMCCGCPISEIGPDGMDFVGGGWTMSHATTKPKPWNNNFLMSALKGRPPSLAEHNYWMNVLYPLAPYQNRSRIKFKILCLKIASFIGRFYRRY